MDMSHYRIVSVGIVAADRKAGSKFIEVYPFEKIPFFEGEISDAITPTSVSAEGPGGHRYTVNLDRSMTIKAGWQGSTNRRTPPDVKYGEQVKIWTTGNSEEYFWESMGRDDRIRRTETIVYSFAASSAGDDEDIDITDDNHYSLTVDTLGQHLTLRTSSDNGELCRYTIQINTKEGHMTGMDDEGNIIQLDTKNTKITLLNKDGTFLTLNKEDIKAFAPNNIEVTADNDIIAKSGNDTKLKVGNDLTVEVKNNYKTTTTNNHELTVEKGDFKVEVLKGNTEFNALLGNVSLNIPVGTFDLTMTAQATINMPLLTFNGVITHHGAYSSDGIVAAKRGVFENGPFT